MTDEELMGAALAEARIAADLGEVPVGAVVARRGEIVAAAHNTRETQRNALHHAELLAIDAAARPWGAGGCGSASCLSPWSPAPCAPGPSSTAGSNGWCTAPPTPRPGAAGR